MLQSALQTLVNSEQHHAGYSGLHRHPIYNSMMAVHGEGRAHEETNKFMKKIGDGLNLDMYFGKPTKVTLPTVDHASSNERISQLLKSGASPSTLRRAQGLVNQAHRCRCENNKINKEILKKCKCV